MDHPEITKLYKYRSFSDRTLNMLANNQLYFAASFTFNDPFDCRARKEFEFTDDKDLIERMAPLEAAHQSIAVDQAVKYLEKIISDNRKEEYLDTKSSLFQKLVLEQFGICSFSEVSDDILMWSHYSDGHQGFCLEFERSPDNMLQWARPVEYPNNDEFPYVEYWRQNPSEQIEEFVKIVTTKSQHWCYEKEWRALDRPEQIDEHYKGHIKTHPETMLKGVILGVRMPTEKRKAIKEVLAGRNIVLHEAKIVRNRFQIEVVSETSEMEEEPIKDQGSENGSGDRAVIFMFGVLLFIGILVAYGKFLWPLVFGRMHSEGITFIAAIQDTSLHAIAFVTLAVCWVAVALLVFLRRR